MARSRQSSRPFQNPYGREFVYKSLPGLAKPPKRGTFWFFGKKKKREFMKALKGKLLSDGTAYEGKDRQDVRDV